MKKTIYFSLIILLLSQLFGCQTKAPDYLFLGIKEDGNAKLNIIIVDVDNLDNANISDLKAIVKKLISESPDKQKMFEENNAYYFFDKSQQVTLETATAKDAKAYYWYLTKLLIRRGSSEREEIDWK